MNADLERWYLQANLERDPKLLKQRDLLVTEMVRGLKPQGALELVRLHLGLPSYDRGAIGKLFDAVKDQGLGYARPEISEELRILAGAVLTEVMMKAQKAQSDQLKDLIASSMLCATGQPTAVAAFPRLTASCHQHYALRTIQRNSTELKSKSSEIRIQLSNVKITEIPAHKVTWNARHPVTGQSLMVEHDIPTRDSLNKNFAHIETTINNTISALDEAVQQINESIRKTIKATPGQLSLVREETDILWWLYGERSNDLKKPFAEIDVSVLCFLVAKELADLTQVAPGPYSALGFLDKALQSGRTELPARVAVATALTTVPADWRTQLAQTVPPELVDLSPVLRTAKQVSAGGPTASMPGLELSPLCLAHQLYQELMLSRQWREDVLSEDV